LFHPDNIVIVPSLGKRSLNQLRIGKRGLQQLRLGKKAINQLRIGKRSEIQFLGDNAEEDAGQ
jgi:hypothetical protein